MAGERTARAIPVTEPPPLLMAVSSVEIFMASGGEIRWHVKVYDADPEEAKKRAQQIHLDLTKAYYPQRLKGGAS